ncbi:MAG TPA: hypothetical protein IAB59_00175 [Candidatus Onthousia faecipullorum]|uniref:Uncharacterized protein n=1 Tax=Candidatus Onthousia faecipullorum TaxID=2840887 RepID=A0A9D1G9Y4_9FIRM|nr:hypothetical protein [Candidatus Onthousia faecipullorum]
MKKIIDNKIYDTDNCDLLFSYFTIVEHPLMFFPSSYVEHEAKIFKTKKGTYLRYIGRAKDTGWEDKNELTIISKDKFKEILIDLNEIEVYEKEFGKLEEG